MRSQGSARLLCKVERRWRRPSGLGCAGFWGAVPVSPNLRLAVGCLFSRSCCPVAARGDALLACRLGGGVGKILVYALNTCGGRQIRMFVRMLKPVQQTDTDNFKVQAGADFGL